MVKCENCKWFDDRKKKCMADIILGCNYGEKRTTADNKLEQKDIDELCRIRKHLEAHKKRMPDIYDVTKDLTSLLQKFLSDLTLVGFVDHEDYYEAYKRMQNGRGIRPMIQVLNNCLNANFYDKGESHERD